ncbi:MULTISPECIES: hypothetical protein [Streptomyces]|nr:hypothetical protein OG516_00020 [Streptomyces murinus]WSI89885.1 hypothetical protein OG516_37720 [Streptomyces murinus]
MTNGIALPGAGARVGRMTMRVYTVDRGGTIAQDRGTVIVAVDGKLPPLPLADSYPACQCPRHRLGRPVTR